MLPRLLGYDIPVVIFKKVAGGIKIRRDWGKIKVLENGAETFEIYYEKVKLPSPPPEAIVDGRVFVYRFAPSQYTFIKFKMNDKELNPELFVSNELKATVVSEIKSLINRYQEKSFFEKYGGWITLIVAFIGTAILVYVMFKYGYSEILNQWKNVKIICESAKATGGGAPAPGTPPI